MSTPMIAGFAVGILLIVILNSMFGQTVMSQSLKTITGEMVCLPHKKPLPSFLGGTVETSECAIGFHDQDGKYYDFEDRLFYDKKHNWIFFAVNSNELLSITGTVHPTNKDSIYDTAGVIAIASVGSADGTISIYEAYGRHYEDLSQTVEQIHRDTGGGYSMGIDACNGEPCVRITLDADAPELIDRIPKEIDGYKIEVNVLNR